MLPVPCRPRKAANGPLVGAIARRGPLLVLCLVVTAHADGPAPARTNAFNDPFAQVTAAIAHCPVPEGPLYTGQEVREQQHERTQHGTSCYTSGRCRLPNSYQYDAEIIPRVQKYIQYDPRFADTSVWVLGQRRIVTLKGCVQSVEQGRLLEQSVGLVDDVMGVVNQLFVLGATAGPASYRVAR